MSKIIYTVNNPGRTIIDLGTAGQVDPGKTVAVTVEEDSQEDATINSTINLGLLTLISAVNVAYSNSPSFGGTVVSISGVPGVGNLLTANFASGYTGTVQWYRNGVAISGATASTYTQISADAGTQITVRATSVSYSSAAINVPGLPPLPQNIDLPVISGTVQSGQLVFASTGTWSGAPTSYSYQWKRAGIPISGATSSTYNPISADVNLALSVDVTATNVTGSATATSLPTVPVLAAAPPQNTALPQISGTEQVGNTLTATQGTWNNTPTSFSYQWKRGGNVISGATGSSYLLVNGDATFAITVTVTATNSAGSASATSNPTGSIAAAGAAPVNTVLPAITGTAQVGQLLTVSNGTWSNSPSGYTYQWKADGANVASGGTSSTYTPVVGDIGKVITCAVTATNGSGSATATSNGTSAVISATLDTRPRAGVGAANAYTTAQTLLNSMTVITGGVNDGKAGSFTVSPGAGQYGWFAAVAAGSAVGVTFFDGIGNGGWQGAGLAGNNTGASPSTSTSTTTFTDGNGTTWRFFRQDYSNAGGSFTAS